MAASTASESLFGDDDDAAANVEVAGVVDSGPIASLAESVRLYAGEGPTCPFKSILELMEDRRRRAACCEITHSSLNGHNLISWDAATPILYSGCALRDLHCNSGGLCGAARSAPVPWGRSGLPPCEVLRRPTKASAG